MITMKYWNKTKPNTLLTCYWLSFARCFVTVRRADPTRPTPAELSRYKFSGVTLAALTGLSDQLTSLEQLFTTWLHLPSGSQVNSRVGHRKSKIQVFSIFQLYL